MLRKRNVRINYAEGNDVECCGNIMSLDKEYPLLGDRIIKPS
jgi:hypothetical protein